MLSKVHRGQPLAPYSSGYSFAPAIVILSHSEVNQISLYIFLMRNFWRVADNSQCFCGTRSIAETRQSFKGVFCLLVPHLSFTSRDFRATMAGCRGEASLNDFPFITGQQDVTWVQKKRGEFKKNDYKAVGRPCPHPDFLRLIHFISIHWYLQTIYTPVSMGTN